VFVLPGAALALVAAFLAGMQFRLGTEGFTRALAEPWLIALVLMFFLGLPLVSALSGPTATIRSSLAQGLTHGTVFLRWSQPSDQWRAENSGLRPGVRLHRH
jgi:L-lactate permease